MPLGYSQSDLRVPLSAGLSQGPCLAAPTCKASLVAPLKHVPVATTMAFSEADLALFCRQSLTGMHLPTPFLHHFATMHRSTDPHRCPSASAYCTQDLLPPYQQCTKTLLTECCCQRTGNTLAPSRQQVLNIHGQRKKLFSSLNGTEKKCGPCLSLPEIEYAVRAG